MSLFKKKPAKTNPAPAPAAPAPAEKPMPAYLRDDYPFKAIGEPISSLDDLTPTGVLYEIKCHQCEMSYRGQGVMIRSTYERLMDGIEMENDDGTTRMEGGKGCIGCGNRDLVIKEVDMSRAAEVKAAHEARMATEKAAKAEQSK